MNSKQFKVFIGLAVTTTACNYAADTLEADSTSPLIGGTPVAEDKFRSTLMIRGGCTVARVGTRHILSAAHCVVAKGSQTISSFYQPGAKLGLVSANTAVDGQTTTYLPVTVAKTHVLDVYLEGGPVAVRVIESTVAPDIALLELTADAETVLAGIPIAEIDLSRVNSNDPVVMMGYGCEVNANTPAGKLLTLKGKHTKTLPFGDRAVKSTINLYLKFADNGYFFTPGAALDAAEASLCPGDSGGPVYRDDGGENRIVGVNAYYSFGSKPGVSTSNWHTRFDLGSRFDVGSWLASKGVASGGAKVSSHYEKCIQSAESKAPICGLFAETYSANGGQQSFGAPLSDARYELRPEGPVWSQGFERVVLEERDGKAVTLRRR